jgi:hypothetical protein
LPAPTVFVVDEMQQLLATDPAAAARLADILWHGRKSGLAPGIEEATVRSWFQDFGCQARTVEELGR